MNNERYRNILNGDLTCLPNRKSNVVKIFLSSTFSDTHEERDYLIENIYPSLRSFCLENYSLDFQVIDFRWGITDETTKNNLTTKFCINEIKNCQKESLGPCFVAILSCRIGNRLLPTSIPEEEFKEIINFLQNKDLKLNFDSLEISTKNIFDLCYKLDNNETPKFYKLLDITTILPAFKDSDKTYQNLWSSIQETIQSLLKYAVNGLYSGEKKDKYLCSVTEEEIRNGILNFEDADDRTFVMIRQFNYLEKCTNTKLLEKFTENDDDANELIENLKNKITKKLTEKNAKTFKVNWDNEFGISKKTHSEYLKEFGKAFEKLVKKKIKAASLQADSFDNVNEIDKLLLMEIVNHSFLCKLNGEKFYGREDLLVRIKDYILEDGNNGPLVIHGESGAGKSSLIAAFIYNARNYIENFKDFAIMFRFLGTTRATSTIEGTLKSINNQLKSLFDLDIGLYNDKTIIDLKEQFIDYITQVTKKFPQKYLLICLDSIDQLRNSANIEWILTKLPNKRIKIIYSTLNNYNQILENLMRKINCESSFLSVTHLNQKDSLKIVENWLRSINRSLSKYQWNLLQNLFKKATLYPLYVKIIYDIISKWPSFYTPEPKDPFLECINIDRCIKYFFGLLELKFGTHLVSRCLFYLTISTNGLSENELEDILSIDDDLLVNIFQYHESPIRRFPISLWSRIRFDLNEYLTTRELDGSTVIYWYHRKFIETVTNLYINPLNSRIRDKYYGNIVHYFLGTWNSLPKPFAYSNRVSVKKNKDSSQSLRNTKNQQLEYLTKNGVQYNIRKLNEFPHFVSQFENKLLKISLLKNQIYFNYEFIATKAKLNDILFLNEFNDALWTYYNEEKMVEKNKSPLKAIIIMHFLYIQNSLILNKHLNSLLIYVIPKLYNYYNYDLEFKNFIKSSLRCAIEKKHCQLIPMYNYLPSLVNNANQVAMLLYDDQKVQCIFSYKKRIFISCTPNQLYIHNDANRLLCSINLVDASFFSKTACFVIHETINNLYSGSILIANDRVLTIFELNENLESHLMKKIEMDSQIEKLLRVNQFFCIIFYKKSVSTFEFNTCKAKFHTNFSHNILYAATNIDNQCIDSPITPKNSIFIVIVYENLSIDVFKFTDNNHLNLLFQIPKIQFNTCLNLLIDENESFGIKNNETIILRFSLLFEKGNILVFNVKESLKYDLVHLKLNFKNKFMSLELDLAKLTDFIGNILLINVGKYQYLFNIEKEKLLLLSSECTYAKLVSEYTVLLFYFDRIYVYKLSDYNENDVTYQYVQIRHLKTLSGTRNRSQFILNTNGDLICVCDDKSIKKFNLNLSFNEEKDAFNLSSLYDGFLVKVDDEHAAVKSTKNKLIIFDVRNQSIVQSIVTLEEIKDIKFQNLFCTITTFKKNRNFIGHLFTCYIYLKDPSHLKYELKAKFEISTKNAILNQIEILFHDNNTFLLYCQDYKENSIIINQYENKNSNLEYLNKKIIASELVTLLNISKNKPSNGLITKFKITHLDKILVVLFKKCIYYVCLIGNIEILFETELVDINQDDFDIEIILVENTNDILVHSKNDSKLIYIEYNGLCFQTDDCLRLEIFASFLGIQNSNNFQIYDLRTIKEKKTFKTEAIFNKVGSLQNAFIFLSSSYLSIYEKPRSFYLYRFGEPNIFTQIACIPMNDEVKECVITDKYVTVRLKNYRIVSFQIFNENRHEYFKIIESNTSHRNENELEQDLNTLIEQMNPKKSSLPNIGAYDSNIFEVNRSGSKFINSLRNKIQTQEFLHNFNLFTYENDLEDCFVFKDKN